MLVGLVLLTLVGRPVLAGNNPNSVKTGVSYVWLSDYDSQGIMFSDQFTHYLRGNKMALGLNVGLLAASRFDEMKQIYAIKNTFYMATLEASYDLLNNETIRLRVGAGPSVRHRAEISSSDADQGTIDGSVKHIKTSEAGFNVFLANDFGVLRHGVAGARIEYFHYAKGTPILSLGMHIGFAF